MGDLKVGEGFIDAVMIRVTATGLPATGLAPTCTLTRLSTDARVGLTVAEVGFGIYKVTDMTPAADDEYLTEWAVAGANTIYTAFKLFKVGGGVIADWENGGRLDLIIDTLALEATLATVDGLIDDIIADIGVFPTANYATLAAYVEDIRARLIVILADVTGIDGAAMRGTDGAALVADGWDAALATILDNFSALRIGYLDELDFDLQGYLDAIDVLIDGIIADIGVFPTVNYATIATYVEDIRTRLIAIVADTGTTLENRQVTIAADVAEGKLRAFRRTYAFASTSESVSNAAEVSLVAPAVVTVTFPAGATLLEAKVVASIKANNQTAAEHNIGVTLQKNVAAAGWVDIRDFTASPPLTLPAVDATADGLTLVEVLTITTGQTVQFRWQVDSDNAGEVHYVQVFVLSVEYDFQ